MDAEARIQSVTDRAHTLILSLKRWTFQDEHSRTNLHGLGEELLALEHDVAVLWKAAQFPSFRDQTHPTPEEERILAARRRDLIILATRLAPSNVEILEWLGERDDKEAAFLYAYARGSVSEPSNELRTAFYDKVQAIIQGDPVLAQLAQVDPVLIAARRLFSLCQAKAYENLN